MKQISMGIKEEELTENDVMNENMAIDHIKNLEEGGIHNEMYR